MTKEMMAKVIKSLRRTIRRLSKHAAKMESRAAKAEEWEFVRKP
jgi:hypothetical protein